MALQTITYTTIGGVEKTVEILPPGQKAPKRSPIVKEHSMEVVFPDGTPMTAQYKRYNPTHSRIEFRIRGERWGRVGMATPSAGPRTVETIEELIKKSVLSGFMDAIYNEKRDYLKRATPPDLRVKPDKSQFTMKADAAKHYAGQYALCQERNGKYVPVSPAFEKIAEAVASWEQLRDEVWGKEGVADVFLCGCCRWWRRWIRLQWDPLKGKEGYDPCSASTGSDTTATPSSAEPNSGTP